MCPSCATDPPPVLIDDSLAILLNELALLSRQEVEDGFRGTAQAHALRGDDDGAVDQDRMRHHGVEKLILSERRVTEPKLMVGRSLSPKDVADRAAHALNELPEQKPGRRRLEIFDLFGSIPALRIRPRVLREATIRVVVDDDVYGRPQTEQRLKGVTLPDEAPPNWPMSPRRCVRAT